MFVLTFILIFLAVGAGCWFSGLWNNVLTLINVIFAGLIATSFFEPLADLLEESMGQYTYWLDMIAVWLLFFVSFGAFRMATELLSQFRVKFNNIVELVGKSILSVWIAWVFVCFSMFTMHLSPVEPAAFGGSFQGSPTQTNFMGLGPESHVAGVHSKPLDGAVFRVPQLGNTAGIQRTSSSRRRRFECSGIRFNK